MAERRFIFCDIDGTLLSARGAGRKAFGEAFRAAYGVEIDLSHINFAGATDLRLLAQLLAEQEIPWSWGIERPFFERLPLFLSRCMAEEPPEVFPGVEIFLRKVFSEWELGLVSGNIRACAYAKLEYAGLRPFFSDVGGFGDDDGDRNRMAALALERAGNPEGCFLLGDTPSDVAAARCNGLISVAVCNGQFNRQQLEAEGADLVLDSFEDAGELFRALGL
jgi:phosphoglycolate phosphatase